MNDVDLSEYYEQKPRFLVRMIWKVVNATVFRCLIGVRLHSVRNTLLRVFGAKLPNRAMIYPTCKIFAPWNLEVGLHTCIGPNTELYNKDRIVIGKNVVLSQGCFICTASHDIRSSLLPLVSAPVVIEDQAWIAADTFVGAGVTVRKGAVVGARAVVTKDVEAWTVVAGNPAKFIKKRVLTNS